MECLASYRTVLPAQTNVCDWCVTMLIAKLTTQLTSCLSRQLWMVDQLMVKNNSPSQQPVAGTYTPMKKPKCIKPSVHPLPIFLSIHPFIKRIHPLKTTLPHQYVYRAFPIIERFRAPHLNVLTKHLKPVKSGIKAAIRIHVALSQMAK